MMRILPYLFIMIFLLVSCRGHQPTNIPAPDPRVETFTFDQLFMELTLDQAGTPWLRSAEYKENGYPLSSDIPLVNTIYRFEGDSLDPVYTDLPNLGSVAFDRKDQLGAIAARSLVTVSPAGIDTVYTGMELYYHDLDWHKHELLPGEEFIVSLEADRRHGILYVLSNHTLYRIK